MQRTQELLLFSLPFLQSLSSILPILFCSPVSHNRCCCSLISRFLISIPTMKTSLALQSRYMENLLQRHCQAFFVYLLGFFIMFRAQVLKCDSEDPGCRVPNMQDYALSLQPQCSICPCCRGVFTQFTSLVSLKLDLMS